jgi:hypothetical protein
VLPFFRFGVCCVFLISTSGSKIDQNCTYIRNPGFPAALTTTTAISYTVSKVVRGIILKSLNVRYYFVFKDWLLSGILLIKTQDLF